MRRGCAAVVWMAALALAGSAGAFEQTHGKRLNVILILVDDWGWTDAACCGSDLYQTPHLDALAAEGMRFTDAYACCTVCSPTRAAAMTGQYPARLWVTDWISGHVRPKAKLKVPQWTQRLEHRHQTLAETLSGAGYRTAHVGKWHLTPRSPEPSVVEPYYPEHHGFEVNVAGNQWGAPGSYFWPFERKKSQGLQKRVANFPAGGEDGDYLTDVLAGAVVERIEEWQDEPFFIYFPTYNVHTPIQGPPADVERARVRIQARDDENARHRNATYAAMVEAVDRALGRVRAKLDELGLADNTLILVTGDNGGLDRKGNPTENAPLRAGKGSAYEGGVRVPFFALWPGVTTPGALSHQPVATVDLLPTILDATGTPGHADRVVDGRSLAPLLQDAGARLDRAALYWHYPHYHPGGATPYGAIRSGRWRLVEFYEDNHVELYDLESDLGETQDLAAAQPARASALRARLHAWREEVGAQMPTANPAAGGEDG